MNFDKVFVSPFVERLNQEVREEVERQKGQLLVIPSVSIIKKLLGDELSKVIPSQKFNQARKAGIDKAKELNQRYISTEAGKKRNEVLLSRQKEIKLSRGLAINKNVFLVANFRTSINSVRNAIFTSLGLSEEQLAKVYAQIQKGHGEEGLAVAQIQVAETLMSIKNSLVRQQVINNFEEYLSSIEINEINLKRKYKELIKQIKTGYLSLVSYDGELKSNYFSIVTLQSTGDNQQDRIIEQNFVRLFRTFMNNNYRKIVKIRNSPTLEEKLSSLYIDTLIEGVVNSKYTKKRKGKTVKLGKTDKGSTTKKNKVKEKEINITQKTTKIVTPRIKRESIINLGSLKAQINARLSITVIKNMGTPALENRTGRFARSVQVENITQTAKGYPSISYTYQKYPYQTFEPGYKQGSAQRDPRLLIDRSIREIARELITGRFYTRRV